MTTPFTLSTFKTGGSFGLFLVFLACCFIYSLRIVDVVEVLETVTRFPQFPYEEAEDQSIGAGAEPWPQCPGRPLQTSPISKPGSRPCEVISPRNCSSCDFGHYAMSALTMPFETVQLIHQTLWEQTSQRRLGQPADDVHEDTGGSGFLAFALKADVAHGLCRRAGLSPCTSV